MIKTVTANEIMEWSSRRDIHSRDVSSVVKNIIEEVKHRGDAALKEYAKKYDNVEIEHIEIRDREKLMALERVDEDFMELLQRVAKNIREFHSKQVRNGFMFSNSEGVILGQKIIPLQRVGLYIPGGTASYPSTVLMNAIPAKIAGCEQIYIATPPEVKPEIIAAAHIAGVDKIFRMGGAQAVAAFAYGTQSVPKVDKIVGPGNIFVAEAKRQVFGQVSIDMIAGPSEVLIIADKNNFAPDLAADMLAQAEHDKLASAILITNSMRIAKNVSSEIEAQILQLERREIARESIDNNGKIIIVKNWEQAIDIANEIAPEHLELCVENAFDWITQGRIRNAGSVFIGRFTPEALGDYYAGANHTLPTMGTAKFSSPLSVDDFVKKSQYIYYSQEALKKAANDVEKFAKIEGLTGHAKSISVRRG